MSGLARLLVVFLLMFIARESRASGCLETTTAQRVRSAAAVFVGRVTQVRVENEEQVVFFEVVEALKTVAANDTVTVRAPASKFMTRFTSAREYLVFATVSAGGFVTGVCHGDMETSNEAETGKVLADVRRAVGKPTPAPRAPTIADAGVGEPPPPPPSATPTPSTSGPRPSSPGLRPAPASGCTGCTPTERHRATRPGLLVCAALALGGFIRLRRRRGR